MTTVAKRYNVSSSFLARVCEQLNVPRPPRGYWARLKVGRAGKQPPLPEPRPGDERDWLRAGDPPRAESVPPRPLPGKRKRKVDQPGQHPLLIGARSHFLHSRVSAYDDEKYLRPFKRNLVDILVSRECLERALDIANALFLAIESRGHRVVLAPTDGRYSRMGRVHREGGETLDNHHYRYTHRGGPARPTLVFIDAVAIGLSVFELSEHVEVRYIGGESKYARVGSPEERAAPRRPNDWTTHQWLVSGRLAVHAYAPHTAIRWERYWREKKTGDLEGMFRSIIRELEQQAPTIVAMLEHEAREAEERRRKWEIERRELERKEAERRRIENEAQREKEIVATIASWRTARDVRSYVAEIRALVSEAGMEITEGSGADNELRWALAYADRIDPVNPWRRDIEAARAAQAGQPCPDCGKVHGGDEPESPHENGGSEGNKADDTTEDLPARGD